MFALITLDYRECVAEIPRHAQVKLSRGKNKRDPLVITPSTWRVTPLPPSAERDYDVDLRTFLLLLWKDAELRDWCYKNLPATTAVTPLPAVPPAVVIDESDPDVKLLRNLQQRSGSIHPDGLFPVSEKLPDGRVVMARRHTNGKPK
jgi:hypothetical protein